MQQKIIFFQNLGIQNYLDILKRMNNFTISRNLYTFDEIWFVEHYPIFTQGLSNKKDNILFFSKIPIVNSDRGGKITYHGPGQQILYVLIDLRRRKISVRELIDMLQKIVIETLNYFSISACTNKKMPGVYVNEKKICSLGLRIKKGSTLHGLALNVNMNLTPFNYINPCGEPEMKMTQVQEFNKEVKMIDIRNILIKKLTEYLQVVILKKKYETKIIHYFTK
ncbi:lipoyl(octanoyl) transferase LipB [Buchnera aphidicola (Macrosiphoniella sanborni)]|uniref:Octanoyltransferase n=1 Tax=Buchnera aphidicola (Macrosiphoniella sanborni) TaxID=1241865 RepID=A0A4D6YCS1_9GAMM|nr:lipoyl(octanoyl) transferase LipB [Buchnera aphidicola]QCI23808.1 lipoyl(octanoyl) transferase LipB [Buchnera aphidicola (Macrosiphoniella sanborni)]